MTHGRIVAFLAIVALAGCSDWTGSTKKVEPVPAATMPAHGTGSATYMTKSSVKPDAEGASENAVDTALQWAQKYSEAADKLVKLQQENRDLADKQQKLADQNTRMQADLASAQAQLKEANSMMMDMRTELEKWKSSVLGFRQEMRDAQQAQLVALARIMKLLGGEPLTTMPASAAQAPAAVVTPVPPPVPAQAPANPPAAETAPMDKGAAHGE